MSVISYALKYSFDSSRWFGQKKKFMTMQMDFSLKLVVDIGRSDLKNPTLRFVHEVYLFDQFSLVFYF